jgi:hypothetical protein
MFWYPYTGSIPYALNWSAGLFTTSLAVAGVIGAIRLALLALRAQYADAAMRPQAVTVPVGPVVIDDHEADVNQAAA